MGRSLTIRAIVPIAQVQGQLDEYRSLTAAGHLPAHYRDKNPSPESKRLEGLRIFFCYQDDDDVGKSEDLPEGCCFVQIDDDAIVDAALNDEMTAARVDLSGVPPGTLWIYVSYY